MGQNGSGSNITIEPPNFAQNYSPATYADSMISSLSNHLNLPVTTTLNEINNFYTKKTHSSCCGAGKNCLYGWTVNLNKRKSEQRTRTYIKAATPAEDNLCLFEDLFADSKPSSTVFNGSVEKMDGCKADSLQEDARASSSVAQPEEIERKARVDAVWKQMNKGVVSAETLKSMSGNKSSIANKSPRKNHVKKSSSGWMTYLGLGSKKAPSPGRGQLENRPSITQHGADEDVRRLAAAALSAVKDSAALATIGSGKVEITEVRDFAGEEIEVKKLIDADSKEATEKGSSAAGATSAVDAVLEQIKKKPKLSVLDKTKKDWGEYKEENKGYEDELDAYKKSSNQYLDRVSFLQRADYREFERERDARLSLQAKRKTDMRDDL